MKQGTRSGKFLFACLGVILISGILLFSGCSQPGHTAPAAKAVPPSAATVAHPKVEIKIYTGTSGTSSSIAGFALADLLKKKHTWLRATVTETAQSADAVKTVALNAELRRIGVFSVNSTIHNNVVTGKSSFQSPIEYQVLALIRSDALSIVTFDPSIKTVADLGGKKVSVGTKAGPGPVFEALLNACGIKLAGTEYLSWEPARDALISGKIAAAAQTLGDTTLAPYIPPPVIRQLQARKGFHIISMEKELIQKISEKNPVGYMEIPSKVFGTPVVAMSNQTFWGVSAEFDPEAAYEVVKFMAENAGSFKDYDASLACVARATLAYLSIPPLVLHPAAEKYYKEQGIRIGQ
jgi:TRAP transporter TAXI family solute receptor